MSTKMYHFTNSKIILFTFIVFIILIYAGVGHKTSAQTPVPTGPISEEALEALQNIIQQEGAVQIIIGLDVPFQSFGSLPGEAAVQAQETSLRASQAQIVGFLSNFEARAIATDWNIPYVAYEVDENALNGLVNNPLVKHIQLNQEFFPLLEESVPFINAPLQWQSGVVGTSVTIAIIDTGLDTAHSIFNSRVVEEGCFLEAQIGTCPDNSSTQTGAGAAVPALPHGTHVTGIVAGDGTIFSGVAPGANIIAFNTFDDNGGAPVSDIIDALDYLFTLHGSYDIAAVNLSLGSGEFTGACDSDLPALATAINQLRSVDIATIAASGNNGYLQAVNAPACISGAIAVGSVQDGSNGTIPDTVSSFSNSSNLVDLLAPGETVRSSYPGEAYNTLSGTSMAAPHVTGAFALMRQLNPGATVSDTLSLLTTAGVPVTDPRNGVTVPRLNLEPTIIVDDGSSIVSAGDGLCTLREAINNANNNSDTTSSDCIAGTGATTDTILLTTDVSLTALDNSDNGLPIIASNIILRGDGHTVQRNGASNFRLFDISVSGTLYLNNLTVSGGSLAGSHGGGIRNGGILLLNSTTVAGSTTNAFGGGIYNNGSLAITNSTITGNSGSRGGGISNQGILKIANSTISNNSSTSFNGGGIFSSSNATILASTIADNASASAGGGVYSNSNIKLVNTVLRGNSATTKGGGIRANSGSLTIHNTMITGNAASEGGGGIDTAADTNILNSTIAGNSADAGIANSNNNFNITNSLVWGNETTQFINTGFMNFLHTAIENGVPITNTSDLGGNISLTNADTVFADPVSALSAPTTVGDYHLHSNSPVIGQGSNGNIPQDILDADGNGNNVEQLPIDFEGDTRIIDGNVDLGADETSQCNDVTFPYTATSSAGLRLAITCANNNEGSTPTTDTIEIGSDITLEVIDNTTIGNNGLPTITSPIIINGNGYTIARSNAVSDKFRIFRIASSGNLTLNDVTVSGGSIEDNAGVNTIFNGHGGGILNQGILTISSSTITGNTAENNGGGIYNVGENATLTVVGSLISQNDAGRGGGVGLHSGSFTLIGSVITHNSATQEGGGIFNISSTMVMAQSFITENTTAGNGGGISNEGTTIAEGGSGAERSGGVDSSGFAFVHSEISAEGLLIANNTANVDGGGIHNTGELQLAGSVIRDNYAGRDGGGVWNVQPIQFDEISQLGRFAAANVAIIGNEAAQNGGGIANYHGGVIDSAVNLTITGNKAGDNGGGVFNSSTHPDLGDSDVFMLLANDTIAGNSANAGGGIYNNANSDLVLQNSIVWGNTPDQVDNSNGSNMDIAYTGIEDYAGSGVNGSFNDNGGNQDFPALTIVFVDPKTASSAPTPVGDYRLDPDSPAIDAGDNTLILDDLFDLDGDGNDTEPTPIDPDQDDRVIGGVVDMGMDESDNSSVTCGIDMDAFSATDLRTAINCANITSSITSTITIHGGISLRQVDNVLNGNNGLPIIQSPIIIQGTDPFEQQIIERNANSENSLRIFYVGVNGKLTLKGITIRRGVANNTSNVTTQDEQGGGIYTEGILNLVNSRIVGNSAAKGGGGIYGTNLSVMTIHNSLISGNFAGNGGGGIDSNGPVTLNQVTFVSNRGDSGLQGSNTLNILNSIIWGNAIQQISNLETLNIGTTGVENGIGAISGNVTNLGGNLTLSPSANIFRNPTSANIAPTSQGDYHLNFNSPVINQGENVFIPDDVFDVDDDGDFDEKLPNDFEGDDRIRGTKVDMGYDETIDCLSVNFPVVVNSVPALRIAINCANINGVSDTIMLGTSLSISDEYENFTGLPIITSEITLDGNGNGIARNNSAPEFRLLRVDSSGTLTLKNIKLESGFLSNRPGGAVLNNQGVLNVFNSTIQWNVAIAGGGLYNHNGTMLIKSSNITANRAVLFGGGVENEDGSLIINNSFIHGNRSSFDGAGVDNYGGNLNMVNSTVASNRGSAGIWNDSNASVKNSVVWGNNIDQIQSISGTLSISHNGIEDGSLGITGGGNVNDLGGNISLSISDDVFVSPVGAGSAPTNTGDYHLTNTSIVINQGLNGAANSAGLVTDIDGDQRILAITVDMGADEVYPLPPQDTNLMYNPGFKLGVNNDAGWNFFGSIQHLVDNQIMHLSFPSIVNGWMRQFRAAYPLQVGLKMESSIDVQNPDPMTKTFRLIVRDSDLSENWQCVFTVPPNAPMRTYKMRFVTGTNWEIIRFDTRPDVADANGLKFDSANLQYRPSLSITQKVCINPEIPPLPPVDTNLIFNPNFTFGANGESGWRDEGSIISNQIEPGTGIKLNFLSLVDGWLRQFRTAYPLQAGLRMVSWVNVSNPDPVTKTFQLMMRDSDLSNTYLCSFEVPPNAPARNYYMRFITLTDWEIIRVDMRPTVVDAHGLNFDDVNLRYRPYLSFTNNLECIPPNFATDETPSPPPETELVMTNETVGTPNGASDNPPSVYVENEGGTVCSTLNWFNTDNWNGYLPTSEVQFVFDPFPQALTVGDALSASPTYDANGDGLADTLYDALSYDGHVAATYALS